MTETRAIEITTETMTEITIEITVLRKKLFFAAPAEDVRGKEGRDRNNDRRNNKHNNNNQNRDKLGKKQGKLY